MVSETPSYNAKIERRCERTKATRYRSAFVQADGTQSVLYSASFPFEEWLLDAELLLAEQDIYAPSAL